MLLDGIPDRVVDGTPGRAPAHILLCARMPPDGTLGRVASGVRPGLRVHMLKAKHSKAKQNTGKKKQSRAERSTAEQNRAELSQTFEADV